MMAEDTPQTTKSTLNKDLTGIPKEFKIPMLIRLKLPRPSKRVTIGLVTRVALFEEVFRSKLRFPLSAIIIELLRW